MVSLPASEEAPISTDPGRRRAAFFRSPAISPEDTSLSHRIDKMYRQRKETLRFLRRCEDEEALQVLQETLDPQPHRFIAKPPVDAEQIAMPSASNPGQRPYPKQYLVREAPELSHFASDSVAARGA
eukprot:Skav215773  [mRNA]  locus=scaffold380:74251:83883:+ [translate_table: standard]